MKKLLISLIICVVVISAFLLTGCNLFNSGSVKELKGVYGVSEFFYRAVTGNTYNYANKYDYYLLIINGDGTGKVIIKPVDGDESSYDVTYAPVSGDAENQGKVTSINVTSFLTPSFSLNGNNVSLGFYLSETHTSFAFYPVREDLTYRKDVLKKNSSGNVVTVTQKLEFHKISGTVSDKRIQRAKEKQTNNRDERTNTAVGNNG